MLSWRQRGRPQPIDEAEDLSEQLPRHRNRRQLESDIPAVAHDLGANLDKLLPERGQRPVLHLSLPLTPSGAETLVFWAS